MTLSTYKDNESFMQMITATLDTFGEDERANFSALASLDSMLERSPVTGTMITFELLLTHKVDRSCLEAVLRCLDSAVFRNSAAMRSVMSLEDIVYFIKVVLECHQKCTQVDTLFTFYDALSGLFTMLTNEEVESLFNEKGTSAFSLAMNAILYWKVPSHGGDDLLEMISETSRNKNSDIDIVACALACVSLKTVCDLTPWRADPSQYSTLASCIKYFIRFMYKTTNERTKDTLTKGFTSAMSCLSPVLAFKIATKLTNTILRAFENIPYSSRIDICASICKEMTAASADLYVYPQWKVLLPLFLELESPIGAIPRLTKLANEQLHKFIIIGFGQFPEETLDCIRDMNDDTKASNFIVQSFIAGSKMPFKQEVNSLFSSYLNIQDKTRHVNFITSILSGISQILQTIDVTKKTYGLMLRFAATCHRKIIVTENKKSVVWAQKSLINQMAQYVGLTKIKKFKEFCKAIRRPECRFMRRPLVSAAAEIIPEDRIDFENSFFSLLTFLLIEIQTEIESGRSIEAPMKVLLYVAKQRYHHDAESLLTEMEIQSYDNIQIWHLLDFLSKMLNSVRFGETIADLIISLIRVRKFSSRDVAVSLRILESIIPNQSRMYLISMFGDIFNSRVVSDPKLDMNLSMFIKKCLRHRPVPTIIAVKYFGLYNDSISLFCKLTRMVCENKKVGIVLPIVKSELISVFASQFLKLSTEDPDYIDALFATTAIADMALEYQLHFSQEESFNENSVITNHLLVVLGDLLLKAHGQDVKYIDEINECLTSLSLWIQLPPPLTDKQASFLVDAITSPLMDGIAENECVSALAMLLANRITNYSELFEQMIPLLEASLCGTEKQRHRILTFLYSWAFTIEEMAFLNVEADIEAVKSARNSVILILALASSTKPPGPTACLKLFDLMNRVIFTTSSNSNAYNFAEYFESLDPMTISLLAEDICDFILSDHGRMVVDAHFKSLRTLTNYVSNVFYESEQRLLKKVLYLLQDQKLAESSVLPIIKSTACNLVTKDLEKSIPVILSFNDDSFIKGIITSLNPENTDMERVYVAFTANVGCTLAATNVDILTEIFKHIYLEESFRTWSNEHPLKVAQTSTILLWKSVVQHYNEPLLIKDNVALFENTFYPHLEEEPPTIIITEDTTMLEILNHFASVLSSTLPTLGLSPMEPLISSIGELELLEQDLLFQFVCMIASSSLKTWGTTPIMEIISVHTEAIAMAVRMLGGEVPFSSIIKSLRYVFLHSPNYTEMIPPTLGRKLFSKLVAAYEKPYCIETLYALDVLRDCMDDDAYAKIDNKLGSIMIEALIDTDQKVVEKALYTFSYLGTQDKRLALWLASSIPSVLKVLEHALGHTTNKSHARRLLKMYSKTESVVEPSIDSEYVLWVLNNIKTLVPEFMLSELANEAFKAIDSSTEDANNADKTIISTIVQNLESLKLDKADSRSLKDTISTRTRSSQKVPNSDALSNIPLIV